MLRVINRTYQLREFITRSQHIRYQRSAVGISERNTDTSMLADFVAGIEKMTEKSPASNSHVEPPSLSPPPADGVASMSLQDPRGDSGPEGQSEGEGHAPSTTPTRKVRSGVC